MFGKDVFNAFVERFRVDFYGINNFTAAVTDRIFTCLLYTSDAADEEDSVDLGGCRILKKKKKRIKKK